jgi:hypothetical protein
MKMQHIECLSAFRHDLQQCGLRGHRVGAWTALTAMRVAKPAQAWHA